MGRNALYDVTIANGIPWFSGVGGKQRMREFVSLHHRGRQAVEIVVQDPENGFRSFLPFPCWDDAWSQLQTLQGHQRHANEVITFTNPCKPYLDIDCAGEPEGVGADEIIPRITQAILYIFEKDYRTPISLDDIIITKSPNQTKLSWHLVISTHKPQRVFHSNHQTDRHGAYQLARRIREMEPAAGAYIDMNVYTKDREMRLVGSSKQSKPHSVLEMVGDNPRPIQDAIITWMDPPADRQQIDVPLVPPPSVQTAVANNVRRPTTMRALKTKPPAKELDHIQHRMLDMVQKLHPSAYKQTAAEEDPYNPQRGIKFSYTDRSEPCYTGDVHSGQNLRCWISHSEEVWVQCFSPSCHHAERLGSLEEDVTAFQDNAIHVNLRYLGRNRFLTDDSTIDAQLQKLEEPTGDYAFNKTIDRWLAQDFKILNIQSPLGTGKTTLINQLIEERFQDKRILVVTYRQSLALELSGSKLSGFTNYLDIPADKWDKQKDILWDRERFPKVVCQYNSVWRLAEWHFVLPTFDLVILDEVMSLLNFTSARIIRRAKMKMSRLANILRCHTTHVLTTDAFFGEQAYQLFLQSNISQQVIINDWRTSEPREYRFGKSEGTWQLRIANDLAAGHNIVVVSMSTEAIHRLRSFILTNEGLEEKDILIHVADGHDLLKRQLVDCEGLWKKYRLVCYSPTIESGCDFNMDHFHKLYVYCCLQSTTPLGLAQMTGRVRKLGSPLVHCCCAKGIQIMQPPTESRVTLRDVQSFARWIDEEVENVVGDCFFEEPVTAENLRYWGSIPDGIWFDMLSYNEARHLNGQTRFFLEIKELLKHQGHRVTIEFTSNKDGVEAHDCPKVARTRLLEAADASPGTVKRARSNIFAVVASEDDKAVYHRALYKEAWGLRTVNAAFVEANGMELGSEAQALLVRMLSPAAAPQFVGDEWLTKSLIFKAICVGQAVKALGLQHPLDTDTAITSLQPLLELDFIKHWERNAKVFIARPVAGKAMNDKGLQEVSKSLFKAIGVRLEIAIRRPRADNGKQVKQRKITLNQEDCQNAGELLQLKGVVATEFEEVNQWLTAHPIKRWSSLV